MQQASPPRSTLAWVAVTAAALAAAGASWHATARYGLGLDGDAVWTLSAGVHLAERGELSTCMDEVFALWPPLYPGLIACFELLGIDALDALRVVQPLALACTIWISAALAFELARNPWCAAAAAWTLAAASDMHVFTVQMVTESLFGPLMLAALWCAARYCRAPSRRLYWSAASLAALACTQRYLGVSIVAAIGCAWLWRDGQQTWVQRAREVALFGATSLAPLGAWLLRNRRVDGTWTGGRATAPSTLEDAASDALATLGGWIAVPGVPAGVGPWLVLGLTGVVLWGALRGHHERGAWSVLAAATLAYAGLLVLSSSGVEVDRVGPRLMLPLLPLGVVLILGAFGTLVRGRALFALLALVLLHAGLHGRATLERLAFWSAQGAGGFQTRVFREHDVARALERAELSVPCWSNAPEFVWLERRVPVRFLRGTRRAWRNLAADVAASGQPCSIVWLQHDGRPQRFDADLGAQVEFDPIVDSAGGVIATLRSR